MEIMSMVKRLKTTSTSSSSSSYDHDHVAVVVHEDLICEILFHLPPTHVLRLKSVSKGWYSIISNPSFLRTHSLKPPPPPPSLILSNSENGNYMHLHNRQKDVLLLNLVDFSVFPITTCASDLLPDAEAEGSCLKLVDSCNGLLLYCETKHEHEQQRLRGSRFCCSTRSISMDDHDVTTCFYICNPLTKQYVKLPSIKPTLISSQEDEEEEKKTIHTVEYCDTCILFDPNVSSSYKVISVIRFRFTFIGGIEENPESTTIPLIYVYSSQTGSWRFSTSIRTNYIFFRPTRGVYLDGVMYWTGTHKLACFDVEKNTTWFQPMPPNKSHFGPQTCYFGVCGGRLRLVQTYSGKTCSRTVRDGFDIMEMTTEDGKWTKKYHVNLEGYIKIPLGGWAPLEWLKSVVILHIYKTASGKNKFKEADDDEEEEEEVLMEIHGNQIVSFNVKSNSFECKLKILMSSRSYRDVYPFSNITLFPL